MQMKNSSFQIGGALSKDDPGYIKRPADDELMAALDRNELCLVLAPRQTGKSSLIVRTWKKLNGNGKCAGIVDLQSLGSEQDENQWFSSIIFQIGQSLRLNTDAIEWWEEQKIAPTQRFMTFLENVVLSECDGQVVIFFDEVDSILNLPFSDDFFTCLRSLYNFRATKSKLNNLTFVLVGVTTASNLIKARSRTPFNIGKSIELNDFSLESMRSLEKDLGTDSTFLVERIFYWTNGQPFLVIKLAAAVISWSQEERTINRLNREVKKNFFDCQVEHDTHFRFIEDYLLDGDSSEVSRILAEYQNILEGRKVYAVETSPIHNRLKLSGIVKFEGTIKSRNKKIIPRNRIYKKIFNLEWIERVYTKTINNLIKGNKASEELSELEKRISKAIRGREPEIDLSGVQLTDLSTSVVQVTHLEKLCLDHNLIQDLPDEIAQLSSLIELSISNNLLRKLPDSIGNLINLTSFSVQENSLISLTASIGQLTNLQVLDLHSNQLTKLPDTIGQLTSLQVLDLHDNALTALPESLIQLPKLRRLFLHDNPQLGIPNEILGPTWEEVDKGATPAKPQDILNYYFRILTDRQPLNEAKLILVGFGAVGKTSLVNRLVYNKFNSHETKTEGIQITQWSLRLHNTEDIKLHVWDFGGQEIMHSTHQFFLTERSLYLLVLNGRQGHEDTDAEYWLELIQSFGGDSPVIVVLNKIEDYPFDVKRSALKQKFPNIHDFVATDCKTEIGLQQLQTAIERETDQLEHLRDPLPASWVKIKNRLMGMSRNYISFEQYRVICQEIGESDRDAQNSLAVYLHSLGIALNYKDDSRLRDTYVLNPQWVTNGIYKLLNAPELTHNNGELEVAGLAQILDSEDYPQESHNFLLELMRKFELCFRFQEDENRYLFPDLLDKQQAPEAEDFHPEECLNFRYEYPILPEGLLPRFIVRTHILSPQQLRWRTGVILEFEGNRALVKADRQDRSVTINVSGPISGRNRLLAIIRSDLERIHSNFKFKPKEQVPVPSYPGVILNYQDLIVMEQAGLKEFPQVINGKVIPLNVQDLLRGVDLEDTRRRKPEVIRSQALRMFYSYSHKDEALRDELEVRLKLLQRQSLIQPWHDRRILPGTDWKHELDTNLEQADIILLLVSPDFINSDYCYEIEIKRAIERHNAGEALVLPILLRPVNWNELSFSRLQALPTDLKPVTRWSDPDDAWLNIEQGIREAIIQRRDRPIAR
ncbi:AAA-like domain-containing protein [Cyanobacteria bacterium FACHB-471]|nr:AAA-like domain-containing protein [Cyanobacteria bacterium FACHB-471]